MKMLSKFKKIYYSQFGEDGIIEEIINRLGNHSDKDCVEFGAWDGIFLSNTYNLIKNHSFKGILIEGNKKKYKLLQKNLKDYQAICINKFVEDIGPNSLDNILLNHNFNKNFDLLSIDIDGNDYYIFQGLKNFRPKILCIEHNPTIPLDIEFIQKKDFNIQQGSSALSLYKMIKKKNYHLISSTYCNLIFIEESYKESIIGDANLSFENLVDFDEKFNIKVFVGYDGTLFTNKNINLLWHGAEIKIKQIPKIIRFVPNRVAPHTTSWIRRFCLQIWKFNNNPSKYIKKYIKLFFRFFN